MKIKQNKPCLMSVFICDKGVFAVLDKFLAGFYVSKQD